MPNCELNCELFCILYVHVNKMHKTGSQHICSPLKPVAGCFLQETLVDSLFEISRHAILSIYFTLFFQRTLITVGSTKPKLGQPLFLVYVLGWWNELLAFPLLYPVRTLLISDSQQEASVVSLAWDKMYFPPCVKVYQNRQNPEHHTLLKHSIRFGFIFLLFFFFFVKMKLFVFAKGKDHQLQLCYPCGIIEK